MAAALGMTSLKHPRSWFEGLTTNGLCAGMRDAGRRAGARPFDKLRAGVRPYALGARRAGGLYRLSTDAGGARHRSLAPFDGAQDRLRQDQSAGRRVPPPAIPPFRVGQPSARIRPWPPRSVNSTLR